jgi:hypothetical protein
MKSKKQLDKRGIDSGKASAESAKAFIMSRRPARSNDWAKKTLRAEHEKALKSIGRVERFLSLVRRALERVGKDYYRASAALPSLVDSYPLLREAEGVALLKYLRRHHERVFCYELYHQVRALMDDHPELFAGVCFQGELKKYHLDPTLLERFNFTALDREFVPDFLLHGPGHAGDEEVIVEVKCDPLLPFVDARDDLEKIQQFISRYGYKVGIFLTVNAKKEGIEGMLDAEERRAWVREHLPDAEKIIWVWKETPDAPIYERKLNEFREQNAWRR